MLFKKEQLVARMPLIVLLLVCPVLLFLMGQQWSVYRAHYGTPFNMVVVCIVVLLPFVGVLGIIRFTQLNSLAKTLLSLGYLMMMFPLVIISAIVIGCSAAGVCF
jgi:hypothetical protein